MASWACCSSFACDSSISFFSSSFIGLLVTKIDFVVSGTVSCASLMGDFGSVLTTWGLGVVGVGTVLGVVIMVCTTVGVCEGVWVVGECDDVETALKE